MLMGKGDRTSRVFEALILIEYSLLVFVSTIFNERAYLTFMNHVQC